MASRHYENFDLLIEAEGTGRYRARVTSCPVGDTPASVFSLPFSPIELENLLLKLDPGRSGMRQITEPRSQASIDLGGKLFDAVFRNDVLAAWSRSKDAVRQEGRGLRLRLRLTDAPSLAAMPWELLYDKASRVFYAQSDRTPIVRYLDVTNPARPLRVPGALRILVVIASPPGWPRLDVEHEWAAVCDALAEKRRARLVSLDRLRVPTIAELQRWLRHNDVHVLHFVGHGYFDDRLQDGMLMFSDPDGRPAPVSSAVLGTHVRDHDALRLVVLNACQTARAADSDPYSGMAQGLIQQEADAVVAMQFPISDDAAIVFTREFYGAVADGEPLDQAMASTRKALLADHGQEWATPVLFLRAADGRVFDRVGDPRMPAAAPMPSAVSEPKMEQPETRTGIGQIPVQRTAQEPRQRPPTSPPPAREARPHEPPKPPDQPAVPAPHRRPRKRYWIAVAAAAAVIAIISAAIVVGLHHHSPASGAHVSPPPVSQSTVTQQKSPTGPDGVVIAYFNALNNAISHNTSKNWKQVGRLGGQNLSRQSSEPYEQWVQGYRKTYNDNVTITSTQGRIVWVLLVAIQRNGDAEIYHNVYTVHRNAITHGSGPQQQPPPYPPSTFKISPTLLGNWKGHDSSLRIYEDGIGVSHFMASQNCRATLSQYCNSTYGGVTYPGGVIVFRLSREIGDKASGTTVDGSAGSGITVTIKFTQSADSIDLTTDQSSTSYCGPRAPAGRCGT